MSPPSRSSSPTRAASSSSISTSPILLAHPVHDTYTYTASSSLTDSFVAVSPVPSSSTMASPILAPVGGTPSGLRVQSHPTYADIVKGTAAAPAPAPTQAPRARGDAPSIDEAAEDVDRTPTATTNRQRGLLSGKKTKPSQAQDLQLQEHQVSLRSRVWHIAVDKFFSHFLHGFLFGALANIRYEVQLAGGLWRLVFHRPLPPPSVTDMANPRYVRRGPAGW